MPMPKTKPLTAAAVRKAAKYYDLAPIIERFGAWAVTTYGIECLENYYPIELSRVEESDWVPHMRDKDWVNLGDFVAALSYAKELHAMRKRLTVDGRILQIFLCHAQEDKPAVRDLRNRLLAVGTDPWLDEEKLLPGQDWKLEVKRAIRRSDIVIICLSKKAVSKTGFVQKELKEALDAADERPEGQIFIIPARFDKCAVPDSLQGRQWVDLFAADGFERLTRALESFCAARRPK